MMEKHPLKSNHIDVLDSGIKPALEHMQKDAELLDNAATLHRPLLHLYEWRQKSITYGHFIKPWELICEDKASSFDIAKRPTGGGLIFHYADFSFSFFVPHGHPKISATTIANYHLINSCVVDALQKLLGTVDAAFTLLEVEKKLSHDMRLCMATPTQYDIMLDGMKVGGASQRRTKLGLLHQSSIFLAPPDWTEVYDVLIHPTHAIDMKNTSKSLFAKFDAVEELRKTRREIAFLLLHSLEKSFSID